MISKKLSQGVIGERFIIYHALSKICHFDLFTFMTWGDYKCNKYIQQYVQMQGRGSPRKFAPTPFMFLFCSDPHDLWLVGLSYYLRALQNIFSHPLLLDFKVIQFGTYIQHIPKVRSFPLKCYFLLSDPSPIIGYICH